MRTPRRYSAVEAVRDPNAEPKARETMKALYEALRDFDGKAMTILSEARATLGGRPSFLSDLVRLAAHDEANVSAGATWLIKDHLETGGHLTRAQTKALIGGLDAMSFWQSQLHVCQSVQYLKPSAEEARACADWLTPLLQSERPFLRAWSMDALQHLALRNAGLAARAEAALNEADADPAASVRARARNLRKRSAHR